MSYRSEDLDEEEPNPVELKYRILLTCYCERGDPESCEDMNVEQHSLSIHPLCIMQEESVVSSSMLIVNSLLDLIHYYQQLSFQLL